MVEAHSPFPLMGKVANRHGEEHVAGKVDFCPPPSSMAHGHGTFNKLQNFSNLSSSSVNSSLGCKYRGTSEILQVWFQTTIIE